MAVRRENQALGALAVAACLAFAACSAATDDSSGAGGAPGDAADDGDRLEKFVDLGSGDIDYDESATTSACEAGRWIYLMTDQELLLRLDPETLRIEELADIACPTESTPNSMAIDRHGQAWVGYRDGSIWNVSLDTLECEDSGYEAAQLDWTWFGMAFVSNGPGSDEETLFLAESDVETSLGRIDGGSLELERVSAFQDELEGARCELTGLGDGRGFALCPGARTYLAEFDKTSGATLAATELPFLAVGSFAFAHWGGRFFLFTSVEEGVSRIDRYTPGLGTERLEEHVPYEILGAGVSTCAPTQQAVK